MKDRQIPPSYYPRRISLSSTRMQVPYAWPYGGRRLAVLIEKCKVRKQRTLGPKGWEETSEDAQSVQKPEKF